MTTPKNDHSPERRCTCPPKVGGPNVGTEENCVVTMILSAQTSFVGSSLLPLAEIAGASQDWDHSFESLQRALSSRGGRESLYALPIDEAVGVIDALEQGSREGSPLCAHHRKRFSMVLRKMCLEHGRLPPSYTTTDELRLIGEYPCGRGGNADVWRGTYRGSKVAIKVLRVNSRDFRSLEKKFCCEVVLWKQFKHPNLLRLVGAKKPPSTMVMISEWMEYGTIMDFVAVCPATNRLKLLADIARGLEYLHDWPSVHADLKSSNILVDSSQTARIADFGLASLLRNPSISISVTAPAWGGTYPWMPPELFDGSRPSRESDVYALGMVTYEVFAHERPFSHLPYHAIPVRVHKGERPSRLENRDIIGLSEDVQMLMEQCWDQVPTARPRAADALAIFEASSRGWVSPSPEAIASLSLGHPTSQDPPMAEPTDTMSETGFGTVGGDTADSREVGHSPSRSNGREGITVI